MPWARSKRRRNSPSVALRAPPPPQEVEELGSHCSPAGELLAKRGEGGRRAPTGPRLTRRWFTRWPNTTSGSLSPRPPCVDGAGEGGVTFGVWVNAISGIRFPSPRLIDLRSEWDRVEEAVAEEANPHTEGLQPQSLARKDVCLAQSDDPSSLRVSLTLGSLSPQPCAPDPYGTAWRRISIAEE